MFNGDPTRSVTTFHYDDDTGRLTHAVTVHESGWKRSDREAALEWAVEQDLICDGCGLPRDETMGDEATGEAVEWNAIARRCRGCEALSASARALAKIEEPDPTAGIKWRLERAE